jgi:predicted SnoaL-like aldol condensation-catalyzing enzyme
MSKKQLAINAVQSIETGDKNAFKAINPNKYIQHNLTLETGISGIVKAVESVPVGVLKAKVIRAFEDGEYVFTHTDYDYFGPKVGFDVFRFENDLIVEHWDNLQVKRDFNKSGRSMLDGTTEIKELDKTDANKKLVETFFRENILNQENTFAQYMTPNFAQHNPDGSDGLSGLADMMQFFNGGGNTMRYDRIFKVLGEGNFVLLMSEGVYGANGGAPTAFYDLFRTENGMIVEHWDVLETILPEGDRKNSNGKF